MTQKEQLERALLMEPRTLQRQRLLRQLWRLDHERAQPVKGSEQPKMPTADKKGKRPESKAVAVNAAGATIGA